MSIRLGKIKVFPRNYETYRILLAKNQMDMLRDFSDVLDGQGLVNIDDAIISELEAEADSDGRKVRVGGQHFLSMAYFVRIARSYIKALKGRDIIMIISGKITMEMYVNYFAELCQNAEDDYCFFLCVIDREEQKDYLLTYAAY